MHMVQGGTCCLPMQRMLPVVGSAAHGGEVKLRIHIPDFTNGKQLAVVGAIPQCESGCSCAS